MLRGSYQDTPVWQQSIELAVRVYAVTSGFPSDERFALTSQVRRAAVSVSSSIAEGWGRGSRRELANRLCISRGSLKELESDLVLAARFEYAPEAALTPVNDQIDEIGRQLTAWRNSILR